GYPAVCEHDSAALNARQCREACGVRARNEPLTTNVMLQRTARTTKQEDAACVNARKTRQTTKHAKGNNAGHPGTAKRRFANTKPERETREALGRKMLCRLTPSRPQKWGVAPSMRRHS